MRPPSKRRQVELALDEDIVHRLYIHACEQFGKAVVDKNLTHLWDLRCMWGMLQILSFDSTRFHTLGEMLWIAEEICGLRRKSNDPN